MDMAARSSSEASRFSAAHFHTAELKSPERSASNTNCRLRDLGAQINQSQSASAGSVSDMDPPCCKLITSAAAATSVAKARADVPRQIAIAARRFVKGPGRPATRLASAQTFPGQVHASTAAPSTKSLAVDTGDSHIPMARQAAARARARHAINPSEHVIPTAQAAGGTAERSMPNTSIKGYRCVSTLTFVRVVLRKIEWSRGSLGN